MSHLLEQSQILGRVHSDIDFKPKMIDYRIQSDQHIARA